MNHKSHLRKCRFVVIAIALAHAVAAGAGQDTDLDRCAKLVSDAARLACFDALSKEQRAADSAPEADAPQPAQDNAPPAEAVVPAAVLTAPDEEAREQPPAASTTTQHEAVAEEAPPVQPQPESQNAKAKRPKEYTATVVAIRERPLGQMVVTLDNGEAWTEQYASHAFLVEVGDQITMKKGALSSAYRLVSPAGRAYKMTLLD